MKPISILARGTMAALTLLLIGTTACTDSHDPLNPDQGTLPAAGVTSFIAPKPGYNDLTRTDANTRTTTTDGSWQTGDEVLAQITFYTDAQGTQAVSLDANGTPQPVVQTLIYTTTGLWTAAPAVVVIAPAARSMRVTYTYIGLPDPLTATREQITGHVTHAKGTAIRPDKPEEAFEPTDDNRRLIPIGNVTGTLTLSAAFERRSALVSVDLQPGQEVELTTPYAQTGIEPDGNNVYLLRATLAPATAPATAHFHLMAPPATTPAQGGTQADAATTFTLRLAGVEKTAYKDVPMRAGWKYALDARSINGSGGENQQFVTASGMQELDPSKFNADNPVWIITGGGDNDDDAVWVTDNVYIALDALPAGTSNIELVLADVKTVGQQAFRGRTELRSVHAPAATSIGKQAFNGCAALTTVTLPQATGIGEKAFEGCQALKTFSLPQAKNIGKLAFLNCIALETITLPQATDIGVQAFYGCAALKTLSLPQAKSIEQGAFISCIALTTVSLPQATNIGKEPFNNCKALTHLDLSAAGSITLHDWAFFSFNNAKCTLVLNTDKKAGGTGKPNVAADGKTWGTDFNGNPLTWLAIEYPSAP